MIHCFKCGSDLADNMIYCLQCGNRLETDAGAETVIAQVRPATRAPLSGVVKAVAGIALLALGSLVLYWAVFLPSVPDANQISVTSTNEPEATVTPPPTPAPVASKAKPSPTAVAGFRPKTGCYLSNGGKGVTLRLDCETKDCNKDKTTVAMTVPDGTSVELSPAPPTGNWRVIVIGNQTYYVAASRVVCN
jgi:hypothetical protein